MYLDKARIFCTGGLYVPSGNIFVGNAAESFIKSTFADILFFSSQAISEDGEISDASEEETSLRRTMLSRATKKVFLCDSSKLCKKRTFTLCTKDDVDEMICDTALPWEE
jgi:DeoR/GlpR family transcriptional regulator of sugar metabolism